MSMGEELMAEMFAFDAEHYANIHSGMWTTRDGNQVNIKNMSRKHLRNAISVLERGNSPFAEEWMSRMTAELEFREYIDKIVAGEL